jgi:hypothetical protein
MRPLASPWDCDASVKLHLLGLCISLVMHATIDVRAGTWRALNSRGVEDRRSSQMRHDHARAQEFTSLKELLLAIST